MNFITTTAKPHRADLDLLKGFAIVAVVLYHMGITPSGYLGVDVFFVINGFLIIPSVINNIANERFNYFSFLEKRVARLLPLILLLCGISLLVGYAGMLPDDYENLAQSVIATNFFSNNILAALTTKNYWDVVNEFKPLMHTWYIGILFEFYLVFPLAILIVKKLSQKYQFDFKKYATLTTVVLTLFSIGLYLNPSVSGGDKFYLLPYRFFELSFGGIVGVWIVNYRQKRLYKNNVLSGSVFLFLLFVLFLGALSFGQPDVKYDLVSGAVYATGTSAPPPLLLLLTVILTAVFTIFENDRNRYIARFIKISGFCLLGIMSYSIFIWHQPILAFYRYFVSSDITPLFSFVFFIVLFVLSVASFRFVEQKITITLKTKIGAILSFIIISGFAFDIYMHAGVVRDVPELNIQKSNVRRKMLSEYTDRVYRYNADFPENGKLNVLIVGNSFARDWGNILLESEMADKINLSYVFRMEEKYISRVRKSDYIFFFGWKHNVPSYVWDNIKSETTIWGIGTKNYGTNNGIIYKNRYRADYFRQTARINPNFFTINDLLKAEWGEKYIDLLEMSLADKESVVVFSQDNKFLSQDTRHLVKGGAEYYAKKIDFKKIFTETSPTKNETNNL